MSVRRQPPSLGVFRGLGWPRWKLRLAYRWSAKGYYSCVRSGASIKTTAGRYGSQAERSSGISLGTPGNSVLQLSYMAIPLPVLAGKRFSSTQSGCEGLFVASEKAHESAITL